MLVARAYKSATRSALAGTLRLYSTPTELPVPNKKKVWDSVDDAVKDVKTGDTLLVGGELYLS
jgi:3-oxoacid CoA-transferase